MNANKVALLLSSPADPHATAVAAQLERLNAPYLLWSLSDFLTRSSITFSPDGGADKNYLRVDAATRVAFEQLQSIWFRRPGKVTSKPMPEPWVETLIETEARNTLGGVFRSLDCVMVNHPGNDAESLYKLRQLKEARRVGLTVPETIVTSEPEIVAEFYERLGGNVIYKLIGENTNFCFPAFEFPAGIPTLPLREVDLSSLEQVRLAPHLFQERVEKEFEVRATIVGSEIFAARIDSKLGKSELDWRMDYDVPMKRIDLPESTAQQCLALMRVFSLNYAAFDFCVDKEGNFVFLELNCAGQYLWLEKRTDCQISRQLALLLSGNVAPLVSNS